MKQLLPLSKSYKLISLIDFNGYSMISIKIFYSKVIAIL